VLQVDERTGGRIYRRNMPEKIVVRVRPQQIMAWDHHKRDGVLAQRHHGANTRSQCA